MKKDKWVKYYKATKNRAPRKLLIEALVYVKSKNKSLDLGAGALVDSIFLLSEGFKVSAVDNSPYSKTFAKVIINSNFTFFQSTFDQFNFKTKNFDLISAQFALPFNNPKTFNLMFRSLKRALKVDGVFVGQFFGKNDGWNTPESKETFHTLEEVKTLLSKMKIIKLLEQEKDGQTASGDKKHWHTFDVIAIKK